MKKRFFNLAVAMSVIASSLAFSSCGEDEDDENEPKKEQNNNNNNNTNNNEGDEELNLGAASTTVTVVKGESYIVSNTKMDVTLLMTVENVVGTTVTLNVAGSEVIVGTGASDKSYAIVATDGGVEAVSMSDAAKTPGQVLFICNGAASLSSGTNAKNADIKANAGETQFQKILD